MGLGFRTWCSSSVWSRFLKVLTVSAATTDGGSQWRSQDFLKEGSEVHGGPKVPPTKNWKLIGFGPLFFVRGPIWRTKKREKHRGKKNVTFWGPIPGLRRSSLHLRATKAWKGPLHIWEGHCKIASASSTTLNYSQNCSFTASTPPGLLSISPVIRKASTSLAQKFLPRGTSTREFFRDPP